MPSAPTSLPTVLLVDAHEESRLMYTLGLQALGFHPLTADNVERGFADACASPPAVIVIDLMMPFSSGFDLLERLRHDPRTTKVPVIVLTGHPLAASVGCTRVNGCDRFLLKPCVPSLLAIEIRDLLAQRRRTFRRSIDLAPM
jgi:DNA-binding response OmpR family regulator